jgi:restriction system-associated AAA family ATPase
MQIRRIFLKLAGKGRINLNGLEMRFLRDEEDLDNFPNPRCLIGPNGSGKSQVMETLADIFYMLDPNYGDWKEHKDLIFEIEYDIYDQEKNISQHILIQRLDAKKQPEYYVIPENRGESPLLITDKYLQQSLLPAQVIGYTSGENETLSFPFKLSYADYASRVAKSALSQADNELIQDTILVLTDYNTNQIVFIANYLFRDAEKLEIFKNFIRIERLYSFRITIQLNHKAAPGKEGIKLTKELIDYLELFKMCSTCYDINEKEQIYVFDYFVNEATRSAFQKNFENAFQFYQALYKFELLNELIIDKKYRNEIKKSIQHDRNKIRPPVVASQDKVFNLHYVNIVLTSNNTPIDYIGLSDGEHQFVHIFGTFLMIDQPNVLFLLDEPETHFNPQWRSNFVKIMSEICKNRHQEFLLTTHSPFILSDSKRENVFIFQLGEKPHIPSIQTYGAAMEHLLKEAFGVNNPISEFALENIQRLRETGSAEEIRNQMEDYGNSIEKFYLLRRLRELEQNP